MSESYSSGTAPLLVNTERQLLVKILLSLNAGNGGGGTGSVEINMATVDPTPGSNPSSYKLWVNTTSGIIYQWNGSAWV